MSLKRTFGLVGDYGSDSDEEEEVLEKKTKTSEIDPVEPEINNETRGSDPEPSTEPPKCSKWSNVRQEYEDSSLMYKFVLDSEKDLTEEKSEVASNDDVPSKSETHSNNEIKLKSEVPPKDEIPLKSKPTENETGADAENMKTAMDKYYKVAYENSLHKAKEEQKREKMALDWEVAEIQREISNERKTWEAVYSDDEGAGAETEAVVRDLERRKKNIEAVVKEVIKKPEENENQNTVVAGERWKRLQMIAETRVKNDPEKYTTYPTHKFPLRD